ncbi:MAG TPA: DUF2336 domain-containing protein [Xanthobacteraceae bacterium]|nr:DUF2336 domain-containing protein [Xanthobacteraceae bacterium]
MTPPTFPNLDCLLDLTRHDGVDIRPTLLRVLTDLYVQRPFHPLHEERHFTELALRLLDAVDTPTKAAVAQRLVSYPAAPGAVLERLARDAPEVANIVRAAMKGTEAARPLAASFAGTPSGRNAAQSTHLAVPRTPPSAEELDELFFSATPAERRLILSNLACAIAPATTPIRRSRANDAVRRLEMAALQNRPGEFIRELEQVLEISHEKAQRIVADPHGEPLLAAAKAVAMPVEILQRVLLFVNPAIGHSVDRVYDLSAFYETLELEGALRLVAIWRQVDAGERRLRTYRSLFRPPESQAERTAGRPAREAERGRPAPDRRQRTI